ncbi:hemolysin-III family protein [Schizosaccharomyces cryophilus OY26]|uniref:Hemolysin-III family protein n=1 Tax=Schizosaccharomyces cryophilus (strain OY26 / ATCC MYA-4695 / CBS 11777 / NBRC 106824 / NRRL Y48691) TaxID=653667 RepID=S9XAP3_SCHCR|nr:hemolysin-III family protein [Schizosaccharomyces cryophilus OY26]EPY50816.1 hemolysin-III family protein [Schizosaccharomyces cryophilus OY26]
MAQPQLCESERAEGLRKRVHGRRHSSYEVENKKGDIPEDVVVYKFDLFLTRLGDRMKRIEEVGLPKIEEPNTTYEILVRLRNSFIGSTILGKNQVMYFLRMIEEKYHDALAAYDSFPSKVLEALNFLETLLSDLEDIASVESRTTVGEIFEDTKEKLQRAIRAGERRLLELDEIPLEWKNNPFILRGYRFYSSKRRCIRSVLAFHNETFNIWTHLIAFIGFFTVISYFYPSSTSWISSSFSNRIVRIFFLVSAMKCLACSVTWHTFSSLSKYEHMRRAACMDYVGISALIAASIISVEYHAFKCHTLFRVLYIAITGTLGCIGIYMPWKKWFNDYRFRSFKIFFFIGLACSGFLPLLTMCYIRGAVETFSYLKPVFLSIFSYIIGVLFYALHVPEKLYPGVFDIVGNSHQLWHIAIIIGIGFHYYGIKTFETYHQGFACDLV